jgi:hypothetical protein
MSSFYGGVIRVIFQFPTANGWLFITLCDSETSFSTLGTYDSNNIRPARVWKWDGI